MCVIRPPTRTCTPTCCWRSGRLPRTSVEQLQSCSLTCTGQAGLGPLASRTDCEPPCPGLIHGLQPPASTVECKMRCALMLSSWAEGHTPVMPHVGPLNTAALQHCNWVTVIMIIITRSALEGKFGASPEQHQGPTIFAKK